MRPEREFIVCNYFPSKLNFKFNDDIIPEDVEKYEYAVIYYYDEIKFIKLGNTGFKVENPDKVMELRLFSDDKEYYLLRTEDGFIGRKIDDNTGGSTAGHEYFDELQKISKYFYPADTVTDNEVLFIRIRNYFDTKNDIKTIDYRFAGVETIDKKLLKEEEDV